MDDIKDQFKDETVDEAVNAFKIAADKAVADAPAAHRERIIRYLSTWDVDKAKLRDFLTAVGVAALLFIMAVSIYQIAF